MEKDYENWINLFYLEEYEVDSNKSYLRVSDDTVQLMLWLNSKDNSCPKCKSSEFKIHDYVCRKILHPVSISNRKVVIYLHLKRFECKNCNRVWTEFNPISNSNVSYKGIEFLIKQLKTTKKTFTQLSKECFISKSSLVKIFDECVSVKVKPLPKIISFDEVCVGNFSVQSKYIFIIFDFIHSFVIDIYPNRLKNILNQNFRKIPLNERENVEYITIDGWDPYRVLIKKYFHNAKIALDSFHVLEAIGRALDKIRLIIAKGFKKLGTDYGQKQYRLLKDNRYFFGYDWDGKRWSKYWIKKTGFGSYEHFIAHVRKISPDFSHAYALKEEYRNFNKTCTYKDVKNRLEQLIKKFQLSKFKPYQEIAVMLTNWFEEIINSFIKVNAKRLSTGKIERHNQNINLLDLNGSGYKNFERFRKRVALFYDNVEINLEKYKKTK